MTNPVDRSKTDPFDNMYDIRATKLYPGLLEITCTNRRSDFQIPKQIQGYYTGRDKAQAALSAYLSKAWAFSDAEAEKAAKRAGRKMPEKEQDATAA